MDTPPAEELLKKIQELEAGHAHLKQEMSKLMLGRDGANSADSKSEQHGHQRSHSVSPQRSRISASLRKNNVGFDEFGGWKKGSSSFRHSSPLQRESRSRDQLSNSSREGRGGPGGGVGPAAVNFTDKHYLNILQSMGQSVHIFDLSGRIIYWVEMLFVLLLPNLDIIGFYRNRTAENLYGYSASEALGQDATELLTDARDSDVVSNIIQRITMGESWTGQFPVKNRLGEWFVAVATNTPFYDDDGTLVGIICVSSDVRPFQETQIPFSVSTKSSDVDSMFNRARGSSMSKMGVPSQQPLQVAIASKLSNLASKVTNKVKSKIRTGDDNGGREFGSGDSHSDHGFSDAILSDHREDANSSGASTPRGDVGPSPFGLNAQGIPDEKSPGKRSADSGDDGEVKSGIHKIITSKAEAWINKKGLSWPWKGNERDGSEPRTFQEARGTRFIWPWLNNDQENVFANQRTSDFSGKIDNQMSEGNRPGNNEATGSWSSFNVNSTSSVSSSGSTSSSAVHKVDIETDSLDYEILWEDLTIGEQIGQGSCGTVYHALWYGSDVAVKVFSKQEYSEEVILTFRKEVSAYNLCIAYEETSTSKYNTLYGRCNFPSETLYRYRVSPTRKFVSLTPEEHDKTRLETACSYGFGYCTGNELSSPLQPSYNPP
ncbi:hypothetical protein Sjap_007271 [Stephania japonica]|uniref:PAS domain-containing protein n=1 Tax=Stephania japonica TaxID=461633 RepID=A0AAP0JME5_9MAGN